MGRVTMGRAPCDLEGCDKPRHGRGLCATHYRAARRREAGVPPRAPVYGLVCAVDGCSKPTAHKGWCVTHYQRLATGAEPYHDPTTRDVLGNKRCGRCRVWKPEVDFGVARRLPDGLNNSCRTCCAERHLIRQYGIMADDVLAIRDSQRGLCAICLQGRKLHVDHDHNTGKVRGLLCGPCNRALGMLEDDPTRATRASAYLERHTYPPSMPKPGPKTWPSA